MKTIIATHKKYGNKEVLVDDEDFERLSKYRWYLMKSTNTFYAMSNVRVELGVFKTFFMHRNILNVPIVDHKDGNGLNNQKSNLRPATASQNSSNAKRKPNRHGYKGVNYKNSHKKFAVNIKLNGKEIFGGHYETALDAAKKYNEMAIKYHGEFATLNQV